MWRYDIDAPGNRKSGSLRVDHEGADSTGRHRAIRTVLGRGGTREDTVEVCNPAIGDPGLLAIQHVRIAFRAGAAFDRRYIRARVGLRKRECGNCLTSGNARKVSTLDLAGAGKRDGSATQALHRKGEVGKPVM